MFPHDLNNTTMICIVLFFFFFATACGSNHHQLPGLVVQLERHYLFVVMCLSWEKYLVTRPYFKAIVLNMYIQGCISGVEKQYEKQKAGIPENPTGRGREEKDTAEHKSRKWLEYTSVDR